jgi:alkyl hydroperoxide reductase subunit D
MEALLSSIPDYAKDLKLNLSAVLKQTELTEQQIWGTAVASAIAARNPQIIKTILAEAATRLSPEALNGAKAAAAIMGIYQTHLGRTVPGWAGTISTTASPT